jgi:hypothetical protein
MLIFFQYQLNKTKVKKNIFHLVRKKPIKMVE